MSLAIIIQARTGSSRLPNKMLIPFFNGKSLLELTIEKLKLLNCLIIVATTDNTKDNEIEHISDKLNVYCFRGSESDVLDRFIFAAEFYNINKIVRICADNPFIDNNEIKILLNYAETENFDYVSFKINGIPSIKTHYGFWAEYVTLSTLKKVVKSTDSILFHEHVTNYIYTFPEGFNIYWIERLINTNQIRLTVDTEIDFNIAKNIYGKLSNKINTIGYKDVIDFLSTDLQYLDLMKQEILNNSK